MKKETGMETQTASPGVNITFEQLQEMMATAVTTAIKELKKPTEDEQAKIDEQKMLVERHRTQMMEHARRETEMREATKANCSHLKENGKMAVGGQIYSDGIERLLCLRCANFVSERAPSRENIAGGFGNANLNG